MITFILIAAALTVAAVAAIALPLLRRDGGSTRAPWMALAVAAVLGGGASALYLSLSNWSWSKAAAAEDSPQAMVGRLARRLMGNPNDLNGWLMLGRSYTALNETNLAARAYERANELAGGNNAEALVGLAEALSVQDESQLSGRAGTLIERALLIEPRSPKALFFGAAAALHRGDLPLARQRFAALLALDPPETVRPIIEQQIAAIDKQIAAGGTSAGEPAEGAAAVASSGGPIGSGSAAAPSEAPASPGGPAPIAGQGPAIHIRVALSPKLHLNANAGAPLFVFVRDPKQAGPPLAVKRLETRLPQTVDLSAADAMIPGRAIAEGEDVQVVARIARSGSAIARTGDPFGETAYRVGRDGVVDVVIDQLTP
jgi:cytochrome c-type biogenesis protein CcmH